MTSFYERNTDNGKETYKQAFSRLKLAEFSVKCEISLIQGVFYSRKQGEND